jgi:hypothetical protein
MRIAMKIKNSLLFIDTAGRAVLGAAAVLGSMLLANVAGAEEASLPRNGPWPIRNGQNYQPTERQLRALNQEDVTPDQARDIDLLYNKLLAHGDKARKLYPRPRH